MTRTAIIAAMPSELMPLVRGWEHEKRGPIHIWRLQHEDGEWIAACGGAGQDAAARALAEIEKTAAVDQVISTGWAGALNKSCVPGQAYDVSVAIDACTGERFRVSAAIDERWLVTSKRIADSSEKQRLGNTYNAALVDMEAAGIARLAAMRGIPFFCIKGVSDGLNARFPDFNRFLSNTGQLKLARLILFSVLRPWHWPALIEMGENSRKAAQSIAQSLLELLDERGQIRKQNGYPNFGR